MSFSVCSLVWVTEAEVHVQPETTLYFKSVLVFLFSADTKILEDIKVSTQILQYYAHTSKHGVLVLLHVASMHFYPWYNCKFEVVLEFSLQIKVDI